MKEKNKRKSILLGLAIFLIIIGIFANTNDNKELQSENVNKVENDAVDKVETSTEEKLPTCDGTKITENCEADGIVYSIYKYYPAEEEKYHYETVTTYEKK